MTTRFQMLEQEAQRLRAEQKRHDPISKEWLALDFQILGCILQQAEG